MSECTKCGLKVNISIKAQVDSGACPIEGDVLICPDCGTIMVFNADLTVRDPTPEEQMQILQDPEHMQELIAKAISKKVSLQ